MEDELQWVNSAGFVFDPEHGLEHERELEIVSGSEIGSGSG